MKRIFQHIILKIITLYIKIRCSKHYNTIHKIFGYIISPIIFMYNICKRIYKHIIRKRSIRILNKYFGVTGSLVLGLPGSGKTTFAAYIAKLCKNAGYDVYANFNCSIAGKYDFSDLGNYDFGRADRPSYWLFDEAGITANNRNFSVTFSGKNGAPALEHLKLLRHYNCRMIILSQSMDCDIKLRLMCAKIWLLGKGLFTSNLTPVQRSIGCDEVQHQLMDMYDISSPFRRAFQRIYFFRRPYYKYFDTHERPALPHISDKYKSSDFQKEENETASAVPVDVSSILTALFQKAGEASADMSAVDSADNV